MPVEVRVTAPEELKELVKKLNNVDRTLAQGKAIKAFLPELNRGLVETSGSSGGFARGWVVRSMPSAAGIDVRNLFGKAKFVEFPTRPHLILPRKGGMVARVKAHVQKVFNPKPVNIGNMGKPKKKKIKEKKFSNGGATRKGIVGVLAWRKGGKRAFSAYKVKPSTKAGAFIFAKEVNHPGTKGKFAFKKTIKQTSGRLFSLLITEFKDIFKG